MEQHRGLLFRLEEIGEENNKVHRSSAHWFPKPLDLNSDGIDVNIDGSFLLDLSISANPLIIPVNSGSAKDLAIVKTGKVVLPTDAEMFIAWYYLWLLII